MTGLLNAKLSRYVLFLFRNVLFGIIPRGYGFARRVALLIYSPKSVVLGDLFDTELLK